ncbi:MAG TPA: response regulator, partial [Pedobacter sp.]
LEHQIKLRTAEISQQSLELKGQAENLQAVNEELEAQSEELLAMNEELQDERIKSDNANKAKTVFLTTMSHEIRTPMNGVIGMASLLAKTPLSDEQSHYVDIIRSSGDNLVTVINDILDFSKIESGKMELEQRSFNLFDCIEEVFELFSEKASTAVLELLYQINPDVPEYIIGDSVRLRQIILNLVGNSVKFTKEGEVFLLVSCLKRKGTQVELLFEVRDTGIGISEKKLNSLFQPFTQADSSTTRKYGGSGLGLAISKRLVELMKGEISARSELGKGSSFFFNVQTTEGTGEIKEHPESTVLSGKCILVVDDNATSRTVLQSYLESWKINAVSVASAAEALAEIGRTDFDLVITDMCMPEMDGLQLAKRVKETKAHLPVMLLNTLGQDCFEANNQLFCGAVIKPVRRNELKKMIVNQFSTSQRAAKNLDKEPDQFSAEFSQKFPLDILVAEDNLVNQTLILTMMDKLGYKIDFAGNGLEAVEAVKIKKYDLILMDMQMPEMDGLEATKEIKKLDITRQPTIIALTANAMQDDKNICLAAGMNDYMAKPLRFEKLVEILEKYSLQLKVNA